MPKALDSCRFSFMAHLRILIGWDIFKAAVKEQIYSQTKNDSDTTSFFYILLPVGAGDIPRSFW